MLQRMSGTYLNMLDFSNNGLTDDGINTIVDFLIQHKKPVKKIKLYGNKMISADGIIRLLEDPVCGLQNEHHLQELHLSHNEISLPAMEELLDAIAALKPPGPISQPLWLRVEKNGFGPDAFDDIAHRLRDTLNICFVLGKGCTNQACEAGADVHIVFEGKS